MKIKNKFVLFSTLMTCISLASLYGNGYTEFAAGDYPPPSQASPQDLYRDGQYQQRPLRNDAPFGQKGFGQRGQLGYQPIGQCSAADVKIFEDDDEVQAYRDHGFSRGDMRNLFNFRYDPRTEIAVEGTVVKVMRVRLPDDHSYLLAVLKTDNGDFLTNLGPVWFADEHHVLLNDGDRIYVKGSRVRTNGRTVILASEFKKGGQSLILRNTSGNPQWGTPKIQKGAPNQNYQNFPNNFNNNQNFQNPQNQNVIKGQEWFRQDSENFLHNPRQ